MTGHMLIYNPPANEHSDPSRLGTDLTVVSVLYSKTSLADIIISKDLNAIIGNFSAKASFIGILNWEDCFPKDNFSMDSWPYYMKIITQGHFKIKM